jgi:hypothetical protein
MVCNPTRWGTHGEKFAAITQAAANSTANCPTRRRSAPGTTGAGPAVREHATSHQLSMATPRTRPPERCTSPTGPSRAPTRCRSSRPPTTASTATPLTLALLPSLPSSPVALEPSLALGLYWKQRPVRRNAHSAQELTTRARRRESERGSRPGAYCTHRIVSDEPNR